jgi:hypothetical protein
MKKVFVSYSFDDHYAHQTISFLRSHFSPNVVEILDIKNSTPVRENIKKAITELINKCSIYVCFIERNDPNVMFELGYALGINKPIVIIGETQDIPADLRGMAYIQRGSSSYEILSFLENNLTNYNLVSPFYDFEPRHLLDNLQMLARNPDMLDRLDGREFEMLIRQWFEYKGFHVDQPHVSMDLGFDFRVAPFEGASAIVEVKKYKATSKVPVSIIRQLVGAMALENVSYGVVVSSAPYTNSARYFANEIGCKVALWTINDLIRLVAEPRDTISSDS